MPVTVDELIEQAKAARQRAYAPYSKFFVGAAVLTRDGRVFTGCNVENASYGLCNCAERTALFAAVAAGCRPGDFTLVVLQSNLRGERTSSTLGELLPGAFGPASLI